MKKYIQILIFNLLTTSLLSQNNAWIRVNSLGYLPNDIKVAVLVSKDSLLQVTEFELCNALTEQVVYKSKNIRSHGAWGAFKSSFRLNFSAYTVHEDSFGEGGSFFIKTGNIKSPTFRIGSDVYDNTADFLLNYMRQQRCGFNPFLQDSCHTGGGYIVYGDSTGEKYHNLAPYPIVGGWHDASDYLQYVTTTATATFQMLFAYEKNPSPKESSRTVFPDKFQANGLAGANGIPDILDEAKWGLDWLVKMNPEKDILFNQVCDDRDHRAMRMPDTDTFTYDIVGNRARPVYKVTGLPQGLGKHKNRTTGISSTAGKFASAFAAGARILGAYYPQYANSLYQKAILAYEYGKTDTGVCQTAPKGAPYFYEEDNWTDDMALAATQLELLNEDRWYWSEAQTFARQELQNANWIGKDTARHYQYYPFVNIANFFMASDGQFYSKGTNDFFKEKMKEGIEKIAKRGQSNPFLIGTPFIWCSNNYVTAAITHMNLYRKLTDDNSFAEVEAAHRDWLLGCNPWGVTMIIGLPEFKNTVQKDSYGEGGSPRDPHSAFTHMKNYPIDGGLVDGPLYGSIYNNLIGIKLYDPDEYAPFQSQNVVYHDDYGDYSTNEPTMDGTAGLMYYLASKQNEGKKADFNIEKAGAINRLPTENKTIHLVFTGHEFMEGGSTILKTLEKHKAQSSFFFTGDFLRQNKALVENIKKQGHYIGAHSDKHLLYCDWAKRDFLLVSKPTFLNDLKANFKALEQLGISQKEASVFMPPYEWYNDSIAIWAKNAGLTLINFTPGTSSNADYTTPDMKNYQSSQAIYDKIMAYEKTDKNGLNGFILLLHIGVGEKRPDKFHNKLDKLLTELQEKGYSFEKF